MHWPFGIGSHRLSFCTPDYRESRDGNVLLVWGDLPHWMVVDREMETFLDRLDGREALETALATVGSGPQRKLIRRLAKEWLRCGVLRNFSRPRPAVPPEDQARIESVAVNLTQRCNLRCSFCYNLDRLSLSSAGELASTEFCRFLDEVRPFCQKQPALFILGGEPFLESDKLLTLTRHAGARKFSVIVSTNGLCLTEATARELARLRVSVQVSLDGATAPTHELIRGPHTFDKTCAGIRRLTSAGVHTLVSMVVHADNLHELPSFYELAQNLHVHEARFIPLKCVGGACQSGLRPVPLPHLMEQARTLFRAYPEYRRLAGRDAFFILAGVCRHSARRISCGTGRQTVLLDADGTLYPCLNTNRPELAIANVRAKRHRFADVWKLAPVLAQVRQWSRMDQAGCAKCPVRHWCLGGCRGETLAMTGQMDRPSPHCRELHRATLDMMWTLTENPDWVGPAHRDC